MLGFAVVFYRPDERFEDYTDTNVGVSVGVNETRLKILKYLAENPYLTAEQLGEMLGITKRRAESNLKALKDKNLIKRVGAAKNGYWATVGGAKSKDE
ncbi:MAG: winged helix-turn-helix transcriptional regulator [Synergistaceae bacterium]|jgi:predicted HTH transcriptional regulator|nr:winged helix-turn-helix transcriptional regulator [Synergistaceae bacterium]